MSLNISVSLLSMQVRKHLDLMKMILICVLPKMNEDLMCLERHEGE